MNRKSEYDALSVINRSKRQRIDPVLDSNNYMNYYHVSDSDDSDSNDSESSDSDSNDPDNNEDLPEKIAANPNLNSETSNKNAITIMGEIMVCNQAPAKLGSILMDFASKFNSKDLLCIAALNQGSWLTDALKKIRPSDKMSDSDRSGIISLMTRLGGD